MINFWFMLQHRRLRERFQMQTIERHEGKLMLALDARFLALRAPLGKTVSHIEEKQ